MLHEYPRYEAYLEFYEVENALFYHLPFNETYYDDDFHFVEISEDFLELNYQIYKNEIYTSFHLKNI